MCVFVCVCRSVNASMRMCGEMRGSERRLVERANVRLSGSRAASSWPCRSSTRLGATREVGVDLEVEGGGSAHHQSIGSIMSRRGVRQRQVSIPQLTDNIAD